MNIPFKILNHNLRLPSLGLGTWMMGGDENKTASSQDAVDIRLIEQALDNGFIHIDTAEKYANGYTEELIAQAIKNKSRENIFLASKASKGNHSKFLLKQSLDASLKRLGTDYLDLYYLHQHTPEIPFEETAEALSLACQVGKIKHIGVCNFSVQSFDALQKYLEPKILANQVHYNLAFREPEFSGLIEHSAIHNYFIVAWRPLKLIKRNVVNPSVSHNIWETGAFPILDEMSKRYNATNVKIALSWVTHRPNIVTLVKSSNISHLIESAAGTQITLSNEDYKILSENFYPQYKLSDSIILN